MPTRTHKKTTKGGKVATAELPETLRRSDKHAQEIWAKAHDSAVETYGEGGRAHRVAFAALKHVYEKKATAGSKSPKRGLLIRRLPGDPPRRPAPPMIHRLLPSYRTLPAGPSS
ncbi:MAG: ChaB family protein [Acidobacteriota bacterium]